jgi:hypothetical protein
MTLVRLTYLRAPRGVALVAAAALLGACGSSSEPRKDVTPASIVAQNTDTLRAAVGATIASPLSVIVKNKAGDPIDSAVVTFAIATGDGTLSATSARTDAAGVASTTWTLGKATGVQTVTATAGSLAPVTFAAVAAPATASAVAKNTGDTQSAVAGTAVSVAPSVKVTDQFGNPVQNVLVTFNVASGGGSVTGQAANTNATGIATVGSWTLGKTAGANSLTATAGGLPAVTFTATGTPGPASQVKFTNTAPVLTAGQTFKFTTQVLDANNNVVPNTTVSFTSSSNAIATVDQTGTVTGVGAGTATITGTAGSVSGSSPVSVIGHLSAIASITRVPMNSQIRGLVVNTTTAYAALSSSNAVGGVTLANNTPLTPAQLTGSPLDVAIGGSGPVIAAPISGALPVVWFVDRATMTRTDSIELPTAPFKAVMNSAGTKLFVDMNNFNMATIDVPSRSITRLTSVPGTVQAMKMAAGDTLIYAGTRLGTVFEIDARTSTIRRQFNPSENVVALDVSRDGKTLFTTSGGAEVVMTPLAAGGLSGVVDFSQTPNFSGLISGLAVSPDGQQLWVGMNAKIFTAPFQDGTYVTFQTQSIIPIENGGAIGQIVFSPLGDVVVAIDGVNLVVIK